MGRYQFEGMCVEFELLATSPEAYACMIYVVIYNRKHIGCVDIPDAYSYSAYTSKGASTSACEHKRGEACANGRT